jgi:hypothetical protein
MALVALDGPQRITGVAPVSRMSFDLGGISAKDFVNSRHKTVTNAIAEKSNPTYNLEALVSHLDSLSEDDPTKINVATLVNAIDELTAYDRHPSANTAQQSSISNTLSLLNQLRDESTKQGAARIGSLWSKIKKAASSAVKAVTHTVQQVAKVAATVAQTASKDVTTAAKDVSKVVTTVAKDAEHVVAMVGAAPARLAALAAIRSNFEGVATSLAAAWAKDSGKVKGMWTALGGDTASLQTAIRTGCGCAVNGHVIGSGGKPTALEVAAVPVMKAIFALLAAMGIPVPVALQQKIESLVSGAINAANPPKGMTIATVSLPTPATGAAAAGILPSQPLIPGLDNSTLYIGGGIAAALFVGFLIFND